MKSRTWLIKGIVIAWMIALLAACAPQPAAQVMESPAVEESTAPIPAEPESEQKIEITYWRTLSGAAGDAQDELVAMFNASQDRIHVTSEFQGSYTDLYNSLVAAYAARGGPEVTQLGTYEIAEFIRSGVLTDLMPFIEGSEGIDLNDFMGTMAYAGQSGDSIYWLPFNVSVPVLYYNKTAFEEAGLSGPPQTYTEFYQDAELLTKKDANGNTTFYGTAIWNNFWPFQSVVWSEGGQFNTKDYSDITLNDPVAVEVYQKFEELKNNGFAVLPDEASGGHRGAFMNGQAAMILDSPAPFYDIFENAVGFEPAVANYPAGADGKHYAPGGGGIVMSATCPPEKQEAAWEFIKYMLSPESLAYYAENSGYIAVTKSAQALATGFTADPNLAVLQAAVPYLEGNFTINSSPAIRNSLTEAMQRIFIDNVDAKTALDEADAKAEINILEELE